MSKSRLGQGLGLNLVGLMFELNEQSRKKSVNIDSGYFITNNFSLSKIQYLQPQLMNYHIIYRFHVEHYL